MDLIGITDKILEYTVSSNILLKCDIKISSPSAGALDAYNNNNKKNKNYDINEKENFSKERKEQRERWESVSQKRMVENKNPRNAYEKNVHSIPVNQNVGKKLSSESMKGRVFEANIGDLNSGYEANIKI